MNPSLHAQHPSRVRGGNLRRLLMCGLLAGAVNAHAASVTIDGRDFIPFYGDTAFGESSAGNLICAPSSSVNLFLAQVPLPPVDLDLKQLAVWGGDFSANDVTVKLFRYCQAEFSASTPTATDITNAGSSGNGGNYFDASTLNFRVEDQNTCVYMLQAKLGLDDCVGNTLSLARVRVRYDIVQLPVVDAMFKNSFEN